MNLGCYGSIFCNDEKNVACGSCSVYLACNEIARKSLSKVRKDLDIEHIARRYDQADIKSGKISSDQVATSLKRVRLTDSQKLIVSNDKFPIKARKMAATLFGKGIDGAFIRSMIGKNMNPFKNETPAIMEAGCDLIMNGSVTLKEVGAELSKRSATIMNPKTIQSQSKTVMVTLMIMGVAIPHNGKYILRRA